MITLHRYSAALEPGDLTNADLADLWGLLKDEGLAEIFFHDGAVRTLRRFLLFAQSPGQWFYAARKDGLYIGIGVVNGFSNSGNTAFAHLASFRCGRDGSFAEAGRLWFELLAGPGGIDTLLAVVPGCYRGVRAFAEAFGFRLVMTLPGALRLFRKGKDRVDDACVYQKILEKGE